MKDNQQEIFPIVDEEGSVVGKATGLSVVAAASITSHSAPV